MNASDTIEHEERETAKLPKRLQRYRIQISAAPNSLVSDQWSEEAQDFLPLTHEVRISVDPSEFLDYITVGELLEHDKEHSFLKDAEEGERATLRERLDAVCTYEVDDLLSEISDALAQGRSSDALLLIERYQRPKWSNAAEAEKAYKAAIGVFS